MISTLNIFQTFFYRFLYLFLDPEAYDTFADLFHPVIADYHKVDVSKLKSVHDLGDAANLEDLPAEYAQQVVSTRGII